jgi:hypothetical protein
MCDFDEFKSYYVLADKLMQAMAPEQLADCLRFSRSMPGTIDYASGRSQDRIY